MSGLEDRKPRTPAHATCVGLSWQRPWSLRAQTSPALWLLCGEQSRLSRRSEFGGSEQTGSGLQSAGPLSPGKAWNQHWSRTDLCWETVLSDMIANNVTHKSIGTHKWHPQIN